MVSVVKCTRVIAGIPVNVYQPDSLPRNISALFLLHGRHGSSQDVDQMARDVVSDQAGGKSSNVIVITFDHRNHGQRLVENRVNNTWTETERNENHGVDMYAIQMGTARDVSLLIDFLPGSLFPNDECAIGGWGVAGISLGGHATWIALADDPRVQVGIPIIGCPDYEALMRFRTQQSGLAYAPPHIPMGLVDAIRRNDPASKNYRGTENNPFLGKKILVLSGKEDQLVPWVASSEFVEGLEVGSGGVKRVVVAEGVGHECTATMVEQVKAFVGECLRK